LQKDSLSHQNVAETEISQKVHLQGCGLNDNILSTRTGIYVYLNINQLDALNFIMSLLHASTCFEHMCSSSGGQNCTIQPLVSSHL